MKKIKIDIQDISKEQIDLIIDYLKQGRVVVLPTDTIYGLHCLATNRRAINKIYRIKKRSKRKPLLILVSSIAMLKRYCYVSNKQLEYLKKIWPGQPQFIKTGSKPVTVTLKSKRILPEELTGGRDSIAVRLPKNEFLLKIINKVKVPIISTSLNISGEKDLTNLNNIGKYFKANKPDLIVNASESNMSQPSKLIDLRDINNIKILRK